MDVALKSPLESPEQTESQDVTAEAQKPSRPHVWRWRIVEIVVSIAFALTLTWLGGFIDVDPLDRVGQVSALAAIQFQFAVIGILLIAGLLIAHRFFPKTKPHLARIGCAAVAGMVSGAVAGGVVVSLKDTPYGLWAGGGDYSPIFDWLRDLRDGKDIPYHYPPLFMYIVGAWTWLKGSSLSYAVKDTQIIGTALFGPASYLSWRLVLRPGWALAIGAVATLPIYEPVKPYREGVLMVLIPVLIAYLRKVRRSGTMDLRQSVKAGLAYGFGFGVLFMMYSGWFVWVAPGAVIAMGIVAPWRSGLKPFLTMLGTTGVTFVVVSWIHLRGLLAATGGLSDNFMYFDTNTEPAYIAMWRNDRPLDIQGSPWPPLGELGGVGLFTIILIIGLAVALWLGWQRTMVIALVAGIGGAWLLRMYLASRMYETQLVRLYPRTTMILLYMLLVLTGLAVMYGFERGREYFRSNGGSVRAAPVGLMLVPIILFFASAASATSNRLMPDPQVHNYGWFSWIAHTTSLYDGTCPRFGVLHGGCDQPIDKTNRLR